MAMMMIYCHDVCIVDEEEDEDNDVQFPTHPMLINMLQVVTRSSSWMKQTL
jgi:hypothetical protein